MTLLVALSAPAYALIAADTGRWDLMERRWLGPIQKVWAYNGVLLGKAGDGTTADPSMSRIINQLEASGFDENAWTKVIASEAEKIRCRKREKAKEYGVDPQEPRLGLIAVKAGEPVLTFACDTREPRISTDATIAVIGQDMDRAYSDATRTRPMSSASVEEAVRWAARVMGEAAKREPQKLRAPIAVSLVEQGGLSRVLLCS